MRLPPNLTIDTVAEAVKREICGLENPGFCLACGEEADGCEPDARNYTCESCGKREVYGAAEILLMQ